MNDKKLTKKAAEAMGWDMSRAQWVPPVDGIDIGPYSHGFMQLHSERDPLSHTFRPLHDCAQAIALARKLGMVIDYEESVVFRWTPDKQVGNRFDPDKPGDDLRAVVECAAGG